jgi:hypothetical protein
VGSGPVLPDAARGDPGADAAHAVMSTAAISPVRKFRQNAAWPNIESFRSLPDLLFRPPGVSVFMV